MFDRHMGIPENWKDICDVWRLQMMSEEKYVR